MRCALCPWRARRMRGADRALGGTRCNVFINRQLIYNKPEQYFADKGVMAIEHADFEGVERLGAVLGAEIASTFDAPDMIKLGKCDLIEEVQIGEDRLIQFKGCAGLVHHAVLVPDAAAAGRSRQRTGFCSARRTVLGS